MDRLVYFFLRNQSPSQRTNMFYDGTKIVIDLNFFLLFAKSRVSLTQVRLGLQVCVVLHVRSRLFLIYSFEIESIPLLVATFQPNKGFCFLPRIGSLAVSNIMFRRIVEFESYTPTEDDARDHDVKNEKLDRAREGICAENVHVLHSSRWSGVVCVSFFSGPLIWGPEAEDGRYGAWMMGVDGAAKFCFCCEGYLEDEEGFDGSDMVLYHSDRSEIRRVHHSSTSLNDSLLIELSTFFFFVLF